MLQQFTRFSDSEQKSSTQSCQQANVDEIIAQLARAASLALIIMFDIDYKHTLDDDKLCRLNFVRGRWYMELSGLTEQEKFELTSIPAPVWQESIEEFSTKVEALGARFSQFWTTRLRPEMLAALDDKAQQLDDEGFFAILSVQLEKAYPELQSMDKARLFEEIRTQALDALASHTEELAPMHPPLINQWAISDGLELAPTHEMMGQNDIITSQSLERKAKR